MEMEVSQTCTPGEESSHQSSSNTPTQDDNTFPTCITIGPTCLIGPTLNNVGTPHDESNQPGASDADAQNGPCASSLKKDDPKSWSLDDVVCSEDFSNVLTVAGMSTTERQSGLTVTKLRTFCSVIPGLPKGYSNANKEALLTMIANRKKGREYLQDFTNAVENRHETPLPLSRKRGKRPAAMKQVGTLLRFVNAFFHQEMKEHMAQIKNRLEMKDLDKRSRLPHDNAWTAMETFYSMTTNDEINKFPVNTVGKTNIWTEYSIEENSPATFDPMSKEDLYLLYEFICRKYKEAFRNFKSSGHHDDFDRYTGKDPVVSPGLYYFHLCLVESGDPTQQAQVNNMLPVGCLLQSIEDESSLNSEVKRKRKSSPTEEYRKNVIESRNRMAECFSVLGNEKKRDNDRKDAIEQEKSKMRKLELERSMHDQFTYLLNSNSQLKEKLAHAVGPEKRMIEKMIEQNMQRMEVIVDERD